MGTVEAKPIDTAAGLGISVQASCRDNQAGLSAPGTLMTQEVLGEFQANLQHMSDSCGQDCPPDCDVRKLAEKIETHGKPKLPGK